MPDDPSGDQIVLTLPASPEFVRLARLTTAGLATRVGMGYDEVEDLRIAVGEACSLLIGPGTRIGTLTLTFTMTDDAVEVAINGTLQGSVPTDLDTELSDQILDAVVDEHVVEINLDRVWLAKRHGALDVTGPSGGPVRA